MERPPEQAARVVLWRGARRKAGAVKWVELTLLYRIGITSVLRRGKMAGSPKLRAQDHPPGEG